MKKIKITRDIAIAILLIGLFFLILSILSLDSHRAVTMDEKQDDESSPKTIEMVNKHMREVYDKQEMARKNAENLNVLTAPPIYKSPREEPVYQFDNIPLTFDPDSMNELVGKDLGQYATSLMQDKSLSEQIQDEIINDMIRDESREQERKSLAEAIIQKAKKQGYLIEVDENYKVKSVRRLINKENPSVFDPNILPNQ